MHQDMLKAKKQLIWTDNNLFIVYQNYIYCSATNSEKFENFCETFFWRNNPYGRFQFGICFENQFQDQKDCYYVTVIGFFPITWKYTA